MSSESRRFDEETRDQVRQAGADEALRALSLRWMIDSAKYKYSYHFRWLGRPIIQFPQDMVALQEIIWDYRPDLIVETGIAHGGSLIFHASILQLIGHGTVLGIDIEIRDHNRREIERHPLAGRIELVEGSSIAPEVVERVRAHPAAAGRVLVVLDSSHTHEHVLRELEAYSPMVKKDGYLVVLDTVIEDAPAGMWPDRPWDKGNNPKTAVHEFLHRCDRFEVDEAIHNKLLISVAPDGYLRCVKD